MTFAVVVLLLLAAVQVAPPWATARTFHFHHYDESRGMPASAVQGLDQDARGRLWFATRVGLACYDGHRWTAHGMEDGLPAFASADVAVDHTGRVWSLAAMGPPAVSHLGDGVWRTLPAPPSLGSEHAGRALALGRTAAGATLVAVACDGGPVVVWDGTGWTRLAMPAPGIRVSSLAWHGTILHLATGRGLLLADHDAGGAVRPADGLPPGPVYATLPARDRVPPGRPRTVEVIGRGWVAVLPADGPATVTRVPGLELPLASQRATAAHDALGGLYVGDLRHVLYVTPGGTLETLGPRNGLIAPGVREILQDRQGLVWFAGARGVSKLVSRALCGFDRRHGLLADEVSAVLQLRSGPMLLGHEPGLTLLDPRDPGQPRTVPVAGDGGVQRAMDLLQTRDGAIWMAFSGGGLLRAADAADLAAGRWQRFGAGQGLPGDPIALAEDPDGALWVGTTAGLARRQGGRFVTVPLRPRADPAGADPAGDDPAAAPRKPPSIRRLQVGPDGALWIATTGDGLARLAAGRVRWWRGPGALNLTSTYGVSVRPGGTVWVGTAGGLARITASGLVRVGEPALTRPVFALTSDRRGRLWLGTDAGVFRWDGEELAHLDVADGLLGSETNRAALVTGRQGRVWIGTSGGVSVYDDVWERAPRVPPQTWIDGVTADGEALGPDTGGVLPAGTTELVYRFGAAAFRDEHRVRFRTFLEGFDPGWRPAERLPGRRIRYTALPAGKYRLHVQAIGPHGTPGSIAVAAPVRIEPPLWQRPWFRILLAAAGIGLVWLVAAALHDHRYARRLSAEIADRTAALAASEREQRLASARLTAVLESTSDGVVAVDGRGHILLANPAAGAMLGRPAGALPGRSLTDVLPELRPVAGVLAQGEDAPAAERSGAITLPGRPPARPGRELEYVVTPWRPEGREGDVGAAPGGGVIALRDVTERRRAEAERARAQRLESLGVLAGGIAHDFNNLLTAILGHASLIEETPDVPDPERRSAASIRRAGERAQALTVKLLTFARGGAPQTEPCDLGELLRETAELALSGTSVSARLALAPDLHPVEVDRAQMTQVISNLLINARQAMPDGGVVEIEAGNATLLPDADVADPAEPADVAGETTAPVPGVQVAIRDHGPGIAPDQQQRIFEPYFSTKSDGTGLGLAVCHSVVARHGGWLGVRSTPGEGATFLIELPAAARPTTARPAPEAPAADPQPPAPAPDPAPSRTGGRILVLDDEPPVRSLLEQVLTAAGYDVVAVATGEQAIQAYTAAHGHPGRAFAAAIMDLTIPGDLGGAEALARIRAVDPDVRAIVASGYSQDPVMSAYRAHGFVARLAKPFDRSTLLEVVGRVLAAGDDGAS